MARMLQKGGYPSWRGVNQSRDSRQIRPLDVRESLNVTFRDKTARKRQGFKKLHASAINKGSWNPFGRLKSGSQYNGAPVGFWPISAYEDTLANGSNWTVQLLLLIGEVDRDQTIIAKRDETSSDFTFRLRFTASNVFAWNAEETAGTDRSITGTTIFAVGDIVSIVLRRDGDTLTMHSFKVGTDTSYQSEGSDTLTGAGTSFVYDDGHLLWIGAQASTFLVFGTSAAFAKMSISEVRIWSTTKILTDLDDYVDIELPSYGVLGTPEVLYAKLNEGFGGVCADSSTQANEGYVWGSEPQWSTARAITGDHSLVFEGVTSFIKIDRVSEGGESLIWSAYFPDDQAGGDFTFAVRVYLPADRDVAPDSCIIGHRSNSSFFSGTTDHYQFRVDINSSRQVTVIWSERDSTGTDSSTLISQTSTGAVSLDTETLIIVSRRGTDLQIKIGSATTETFSTLGSGLALVPGRLEPWYIGSGVNSVGNPEDFFLGVLDEIALWMGISYDADELRDFLEANNGIPFGDTSEISYDTGSVTAQRVKIWEALAIYYKFEEGEGTIVRDSGPGFTSGQGEITNDVDIAGLSIMSGRWDEPLTESLESPPIRGLFDFNRCDCTRIQPGQHILAQAGGGLFRLLSGSLEFVGAGIVERPGWTTLFEAFADFVVLANPGDQPYEYDGVRLTSLNVEQPKISAVTSENVAGNLTATDEFRVRLTFLNRSSGKRSVTSKRSAKITIGASDNCLRVVWRAPEDEQVSHVEVWCTFPNQADSGAYFFIEEVPITAAKTLIQDPPDRLAVTEQLDIALLKVPQVSSLASFRGRMWYVDALNPREVLWSVVNRPELIEGSIILNEECTGLVTQRGQLIAFTRSKKLGLVGQDETDFDFVPFNPDVGTVDARTIAQREDTLFYLTQSGWYADTYSSQRYVGEDIISEFEALNLLSAALFAGAYHDRDHQLLFSCLSGGSARNNRLYAFNLARAADEEPSWEIHGLELEALAAVRDPQDDRTRLYAGWRGHLIEAFAGTNDGASGASNLTGTLTNASAITGAFNSGAAWPTSGDGLKSCVFENVTQTHSARIFQNTATSLIFPVTGGTNSPGDLYRIAAIPLRLRTRLEDFATSDMRNFVSEYFLDLEVQAGGGTISACAIIDGAFSVTARLAQGASIRQIRTPLRRSAKHIELEFTQDDPDVSLEIFRAMYHHKQTQARWTYQ